jgi:hypothetical protein
LTKDGCIHPGMHKMNRTHKNATSWVQQLQLLRCLTWVKGQAIEFEFFSWSVRWVVLPMISFGGRFVTNAQTGTFKETFQSMKLFPAYTWALILRQKEGLPDRSHCTSLFVSRRGC